MTKVMKKEFLPVIDDDELVKPMLLVLLESLIDSGIEEICLVIRSGEEELYKRLFASLHDELFHKLPEHLRQYNENISDIGSRIRFAYQDEALGFGHAVLQSKQFASDEPILLMLGDHLFKSNKSISCASQLIDAYERSELLAIGLFELSLDDVPHYGIAKIKDDSFHLSALVEKPSKDYAQRELSYKGKYYGVFMYVITPRLYAALSQNFAEYDPDGGELNLTPSLDAVTRQFGAIGVLLDGMRYDVGLPEKYKLAVTYLSRI
jgi:UTP-glucose-1-phosphate uridylyltransferase